jgi:hypothetical protein
MKLPGLTAEYGIGPAHGVYSSIAHDTGPSVIVPMSDVVRATDPDWALKLGACLPPSQTCWGHPTTVQWADFICCDASERCTIHTAPDVPRGIQVGDPGCEVGPSALKALTMIRGGALGTPPPPEIMKEIRSYIKP